MSDDEPQQHENTVVFLMTPGDVLDERWLIEGRIGQGAMGSVFRGADQAQARKVAIKILAPEHCRKPKVLARFEREAKLMSTLRHPNIIQLYGVGRRGALPYIVMQYLEGMTLAEVVKRKGGKLTPGETLWIVKQISAGLSFVHHHGLVHRDVKPQNIFVGPGGRVTILDLGVVRDKSNPGLTKAGAMVGTPYYMSPEQIQGTDEIDKRTDVYALAAMTFELLVGRPPFLGTTNFEVLYAHKNNPPPDASALNKAIPKTVAQALMRGLAKKRDDRPSSASEFYADLEAYIGAQEKVDPAVAFSFLDEAVRQAQEKEKKKKEKKGTPSTRAATVPLTRAVEGPAAGKAVTGTALKPLPAVSAEIPMARSVDVAEVPPGPATGESVTAAAGRPSDTLEAERLSDPGVSQPGAPPANTAEDSSAHEVSRLPTLETAATLPGAQARKAPAAPARAPQQHAQSETADEAADLGAQDASATVTESGELRVITTLKGLTSSAQLFIDGRPHGATPTSLQVPVGKHLVRVEKAGQKPVERTAQVQANQVALVRIELGPAK